MQSTKIRAIRYHDFSAGHRVAGHESKCKWLHGHNYRATFHCESDGSEALDRIGRVIDFGVIKALLCQWLEDNWDHKFLMWEADPFVAGMDFDTNRTPMFATNMDMAKDDFNESFCFVPFNPTAENMGTHLLEVIGPQQLKDTGVKLTKVIIEETRKCSAEVSLT